MRYTQRLTPTPEEKQLEVSNCFPHETNSHLRLNHLTFLMGVVVKKKIIINKFKKNPLSPLLTTNTEDSLSSVQRHL